MDSSTDSSGISSLNSLKILFLPGIPLGIPSGCCQGLLRFFFHFFSHFFHFSHFRDSIASWIPLLPNSPMDFLDYFRDFCWALFRDSFRTPVNSFLNCLVILLWMFLAFLPGISSVIFPGIIFGIISTHLI